jgi:hypothetical protein
VLRFDPVILDKSMYIRYLPDAPDADEQGAVFTDQGARIGLSGGEQGREPEVDSSDSNLLVVNTRIVILTIAR